MRWAAGVLVLALASDAAANGRPAEVSTLTFGDNGAIAAGTTFGLVVSHDAGATWRWTCEEALQYGGEYDPHFVYAASGALFVTSFAGLLGSSDDCAFAPTAMLGDKYAAAVTRGPDATLYVAITQPPNPTAGTPGDSGVYRSTDGITFTAATPAPIGTYWSSLAVAPSDAQRVYAAGFRYAAGLRDHQLFRSRDGGASYEPMTTTGITLTEGSTITIVGVSPSDPDVVYAKATYQTTSPTSDALFRSSDAGATWTTLVADTDNALAFLARSTGELLVGTRAGTLSRSLDDGATWTAVANAPHINCLAETGSEVWACTQNYAAPGVSSDGAGLLRTTDLATWTPVLRFEDLAGPIECAADSVQRRTCVDSEQRWCNLRSQFGVTANPTSCPIPDGVSEPQPAGCCTASTGPSTSLLALVVAVTLRRRRGRANTQLVQ